jgi:ATP-binding cassette subfamily B protein
MENKKGKQAPGKHSGPNIFSILKPYRGLILVLIIFTLIGNGVNLVIPKIISHGIDSYSAGNYQVKVIATEFLVASLIIFIFSYLQSVVQTYASERVGRNLRSELSDKISRQSFSYIQKANPSKLLTNLTSDIDSVKMFVSHAVASIVSSLFVIVGACILLLMINWKLALPVIAIVPVIGFAFFVVLKKVRVLFTRSREVIDWLNRVINESILGAAIIRVLNAQMPEYQKFMTANLTAKELGISILTLFATLIPIINLVANLATLTVLALGGHFVITGNLSLGDFAAFNSYITILIFPIIVIGFMSNVIAQATASYGRIEQVLKAPETTESGTVDQPLSGEISLKNVSVLYDEKPALKNVSIEIRAGSRTAIIGPTAAGKSQLLYLLTGLITPNSGVVEFDGINIRQFRREAFHRQIGFVFQDSVIFNLALRENIAFNNTVTDESLRLAVETAELHNFIEALPQKLDTVVSERGASLSGGQKQRIMLARALALNPKILLLDDFTARVDAQTEEKILANVATNYPGITLVSVTQKIAPVMNYDQIILLMEGEVIASGTHAELMKNCPEYIQIANSQRSTNESREIDGLNGMVER